MDVGNQERGAGILLHISSLPSTFGIGDVGPEAFRFADFLKKAGQKFWQMLPLNPVDASQSFSPYSSASSVAGNPLLISPQRLADAGYLTRTELEKYQGKPSRFVDYPGAVNTKSELLDKAFQNWQKANGSRKQFDGFVKDNHKWLDDYALFAVIRKTYQLPWFRWPAELKKRKDSALKKFASEFSTELLREKWLQFIFHEQWHSLKNYCNENKIALIGDVPFYVSYDSADVWSNQQLFSVDIEGKLTAQAGVPPDYFNSNGQLWGMPVFKWEKLKRDNYHWWIERLRQNIALFDIVRLDHFRAFADYWEVPARHKTAKSGKWMKGPGRDFFERLQKVFPAMPFIAEDLGEINQDVIELRNGFHLPGMKILQFAFGDNMSTSDYIPHNYEKNFVVYTGTHDNNTTKGWFRKDTGVLEKKNLSAYTGVSVTSENVSEVLIRLAYSSVARLAIIPMQDVLNMDERARMNEPATTKGNWEWKLDGSGYMKTALSLKKLVDTFGR